MPWDSVRQERCLNTQATQICVTFHSPALFVVAKAKHQVIMVTHNAALVINNDANHSIVASAGPHPSGVLPPITYAWGGLESAEILKVVYDILEGGRAAFRERARRLRVRLER